MRTLILGDVCTKYNYDDFKNKEINMLFGDFIPVIQGSDFTFVNLECAITDSTSEIKKFGPTLRAPRELAEVLSELGVTVCGMSNNHIFDYGIGGVLDTVSALDDAGIDYTGFGDNYEESRKNYYFEKDGERICIIAVCEHEFSGALENRMGSRTFEYDTFGDIIDAKRHADRVIVCYHGGKEYSKYPSPRLRSVCRNMVKCGADMVLCQHSHCIGCYEEYEGSHILYGQGNFHFIFPNESKWKEDADTSLAVCYDTKTGKIEFIPLHVVERGIKIAKGKYGEQLLSDFYKRNEYLQNGKWREEWEKFCSRISHQYVEWVGKAGCPESSEEDNVLFAQILKCEAHNDVLREIFHTWNDTNELNEIGEVSSSS